MDMPLLMMSLLKQHEVLVDVPGNRPYLMQVSATLFCSALQFIYSPLNVACNSTRPMTKITANVRNGTISLILTA